MTATPPKAVLFDLDRTLCESTQDSQATLESTFERVGVDPYCDADDMTAVIPETPDVESNREFYAALFDLAADRVEAGDVPAWELAGVYEGLVDYSQVRFREGAAVALKAARDVGPVGLVTNGGRETQTTKLEALGIADAFDAAVFCAPPGGAPPNPDPTAIESGVG
jgi:putative hydrolase of the HAD superfamily